MATTITKLFPTGILQANVAFDEVTYSSIKVGTNGVFASQFDEVSLTSGPAERKMSNGTYLVKGYFDEVSLLYPTVSYAPITSATLIFNLDAANFSATPTTGALDATGTYALTVNNAGGTIGWNASNGGMFTKSASTASDNIVVGPNTTGTSYTVFMAYQPQNISSGGQGRILSCNSGQDWLLGTYAPAPGSGTMYKNVFYPGAEVWLSHDAADTGWQFIWATYTYATGVANLYTASSTVNNTSGPAAPYKTVTFAANGNRGFNQFLMWARPGPSEPGQANIGFIKAYNGALSLTDIQTLWSTYHSRFGI